MLLRLVAAIAAFIVVFLACLLLGGLLVTLKVDVLVTVGVFLKTWAVLIGVAAALLAFAGGITWPTRSP